ncbi:hypothetical protein DFP72DRAFT_844084 [Ephemerocybe angulata]|uniref:Uncharacterized protein n=1 Tax=Ephemerocybe angulata TaxID=980116 RepID=A0A8H6I6T4_9AGAR|nr:hypothetical protein DFP72DRAFT_844084 [Tulosesus angulatus]
MAGLLNHPNREGCRLDSTGTQQLNRNTQTLGTRRRGLNNPDRGGSDGSGKERGTGDKVRGDRGSSIATRFARAEVRRGSEGLENRNGAESIPEASRQQQGMTKRVARPSGEWLPPVKVSAVDHLTGQALARALKSPRARCSYYSSTVFSVPEETPDLVWVPLAPEMHVSVRKRPFSNTVVSSPPKQQIETVLSLCLVLILLQVSSTASYIVTL